MQAGTLVTTAPVPPPNDEAACAARRAELAAFVKTAVTHLLSARPARTAEFGVFFRTEIPTAAAKTGHILHPLLPPAGIPVPGKILVARAGTARTHRPHCAQRPGQAARRGLVARADDHADCLAVHATAKARRDNAEARIRLDLREWIVARPILPS